MRFTVLAWLVVLARLTIYFNRTVLSLPPSLINDAGSLSQQQSEHRPWKKDSQYMSNNKPILERTLGDVRDGFDNIVRNHANVHLNNNHIQVQPNQQQFNTDMNEKFTGKYRNLKSLLSNDAAVFPRINALKSNLPFTPLKYYARLCQATKNCPAAYYRTLYNNRNKTAALNEHWNFPQTETIDFSNELKSLANNDDNIDNDDDDDDDSNNDIILLLTAEHDLLMFLNMALKQLYSYQHLANRTALGFENDDDNYNTSDNYHPDIPFIPPRGRKHDNLPNLDSLLNRYETFVPNRGKRDKIKDMLKYDDLFYPNRGKRQQQKHVATVCHGHDCEVQHNDDALLAPLRTSPHWQSPALVQIEKFQEQLQNYLQRQQRHEKLSAIYNNNNNNDNNGLQQDMSMYKMNVYDQSVKPSMPSAMAAKKISTAIKKAMLLQQQQKQQHSQPLQHMLMMIARNVVDGDDAANRLQHLTTAKTTRSMSTMNQQLEEKNYMKKEPSNEIQQHRQSKQNDQKSLTNFEVPLLWRHLQLLKQKALTMQQPELPTHQHFDYTRQLLQKLYPDNEADTDSDTDTQEAQLVAATYP